MGSLVPNAIWTILIGITFFVFTALIVGTWPSVGRSPDNAIEQGKRDSPHQERRIFAANTIALLIRGDYLWTLQ